jgi:putative oxidoreductase
VAAPRERVILRRLSYRGPFAGEGVRGTIMLASPVVEPALYAGSEARMPAPALVSRAAALGLKIAAALAFLAPLLTRVVVGWAFYLTGSGKWAHFDNTVTFFTELGIPFPQANAAFVATLELVGGICLILGLLTRLFATGLASTMVVALMTADKDRFLESWSTASEISPTDISAFVFLLFLLWLALYGPGPLSLDKLVSRWLEKGQEAQV